MSNILPLSDSEAFVVAKLIKLQFLLREKKSKHAWSTYPNLVYIVHTPSWSWLHCFTGTSKHTLFYYWLFYGWQILVEFLFVEKSQNNAPSTRQKIRKPLADFSENKASLTWRYFKTAKPNASKVWGILSRLLRPWFTLLIKLRSSTTRVAVSANVVRNLCRES